MERRVLSCFLILHYMDQELTEQTVTSILKLDGFGDSQIIIVDNGSTNDSGTKLKEVYDGKENIHLLYAGRNLGFSAGNNLGFTYIKKTFDPDFLIMINNDIEFPQKSFLCLLEKLYREQPFHVAGPDIYVPHKRFHSSPMHERIRTMEDLEEAAAVLDRMYASYQQKFSACSIKMFLVERLRGSLPEQWLLGWKRTLSGHKKCMIKKRDVVLQGSCVIFDRRFCRDQQELLQPLTFLYGEEDLLAWRCRQQGLELWYLPELQVWHHSQGSSRIGKAGYGEFCSRMRGSLERRRNAVEVLKEYYGKRAAVPVCEQEHEEER